ncbi:autotransporter outer membrane beta-barrel domain-containing protein [Reyranella sp.]|uniref:autotransporter outer membrane beta-barrel domain-containing protein n=1 Tax=Reyranella sp. TaxID=1929291 RepID=UPI003BA84C48
MAQDATWNATATVAGPVAGTFDFNAAANWTPGAVPTGTASFGATTTPNLSFSTSTTLGGLTLNAGASDYTFTHTNSVPSASVRIDGAGIVVNGGSVTIINDVGSGAHVFTFAGSSTAGNASITNNRLFNFTNSATAGNATITNNGTMAFASAATAGNANIINNQFLNFTGSASAGSAFIANRSGGTVRFSVSSTVDNATIVNDGGSTIFVDTSSGGTARLIANGAGSVDFSGLTATGTTAGSFEGSGSFLLGAKSITVGGNNLSTTVSGVIQDGGIGGGTGGSLTKIGSGALTLTGANTYSGGTTINSGLINFSALNNFGSGPVTLNGGGLQWAPGNTTDISSQLAPLGAGGGIFDTNGNNVVLASVLSGAGGLTKQGSGVLSLNGANTYTGPTTVNAGTLAVNGSLASTVTVNGGGTLGGTGTIGGVAMSGGVINPGNSIGSLTVGGNFVQNGGTYQVEANAQGQSDRINVGGTASIGGGATVQVLAQPGSYNPSRSGTTYTILRANGGVSGTYSGVTSNFAFLTPGLSYDANDVFLTLVLNSFFIGGATSNQRAVGTALDQSIGAASGDYLDVLHSVASLSTSQGPLALDAISGQQYAGFANAMVQGAQLFMSNFANRARAPAGGGSTRVALAEACDIACDVTTPALWSAWGGAVGGTGTIAGSNNAGTFTYSVGGFAGGLDRKFTENFLAGVTVGYQTGGQWTGGLAGRSVTDTVLAGLYGSFTQGPVYVDALAAYAYNSNQMWRSIGIPGLQPRTAYGKTGANQFLGQIEGGYRFELGGAASYYVTPFALLQGSTASQNAFTETGAQSLNLSVAQQTSGSLRTIFGAQLGADLDVGLRSRIASQLRLGWSHDYADTGRPVTASFAGAPATPFTVLGASPTRDAAVIGFSASTDIAEALGVYVRYEGTIGGQDSSHALIAGLRMTW